MALQFTEEQFKVLYKRPTDLKLKEDLSVCCNLLIANILDEGAPCVDARLVLMPACQRMPQRQAGGVILRTSYCTRLLQLRARAVTRRCVLLCAGPLAAGICITPYACAPRFKRSQALHVAGVRRAPCVDITPLLQAC